MGPESNVPPTSVDSKTLEIHRIGVKVPPFWPENPDIWFAQIEAQFINAQVKTDISKFNTIVASIESKVLSQVSAAVLSPPLEDKYGNLKKLIIARFSDSEQSKLRKLLSEMSLGDQKPSYLLNEMRRLGGNKVTEEMLKTLWLQNLPVQARAILSTNDVNLDNLSVMADKILEVSGISAVHMIQTTSSNTASTSVPVPSSNFACLEQRILQLTKAVENMQYNSRSRVRSRSNHHKPRTARSTTPGPSTQNHLCWYHFKFGSAATKCKTPCNFNQQKN